MITQIIYLFSFITLLCLISFITQRNHILICLLALEAIILSLACSIALSYLSSSFIFFYCILILSFGACEAAVALAVLVSITRSYGSDLIQSINLNKC